MNSKFLSLNLLDLGKAALVVALTAVAVRLIPVFDANTLPGLTEVANDLKVGLAAGLAYLLKQFISNSSSVPLKGE